MPGSPDPSEIERCFQKIANHSLNDWETRFVTSLKQQYDTKGTLSSKQLEILRKIVDGEAAEERPDNEAAANELLACLASVTTWNPPVKHGKRTYDDKEFVNSLKGQLSEKHFLTERQFEALKKMARGYREQIPSYADVAAKFGIKDAPVRRASSAKKATAKKRSIAKAK
jgi:DNA-binding NarL/FixJ family response regulator